MLPCAATVCVASPPPRWLGPAWSWEGGRGRAGQAARALLFPRRASAHPHPRPVMKPWAWKRQPAQGSLGQAWDLGPASLTSQQATGGRRGHDPRPSQPPTLEAPVLGGSTASGHRLVCPHSDPSKRTAHHRPSGRGEGGSRSSGAKPGLNGRPLQEARRQAMASESTCSENQGHCFTFQVLRCPRPRGILGWPLHLPGPWFPQV